MSEQKACPVCDEPYDELVVVAYRPTPDTNRPGRIARRHGAPILGCPNPECRHACTARCGDHHGKGRLR